MTVLECEEVNILLCTCPSSITNNEERGEEKIKINKNEN